MISFSNFISGNRSFLMYKLSAVIFFFISCAAPVDYFGNNIDINKDRIYLSKLRKEYSNKDQFTLIFVEKRGNPTNKTKKQRKKTLNRYIELIMSYYGYTEKKIIDIRSSGIISPRYYVKIQFN